MTGVVLVVALGSGCQQLGSGDLSPVAAGFHPREVVDPPAQAEGDRLGNTADLFRLAERLRQHVPAPPPGPRKSVLCLSGGGAYGAYSAGVLYGMTQAGTRPTFDVVSGISTGSLVAPLAFLGPEYDEEIKTFYTTLDKGDIFQLQVVRGLFTESFASNAPLARQLDKILTPCVLCRIAEEHRKGRRLYVGTTERDGRNFIVWDIGAIASRGQADDRDLIKRVLLGSAAIPGFFPASKIPVTVDGQGGVEHHIDGGTSVSVFFRPPYAPPGQGGGPEALAGTDLYVIIAGKLFADPEVVKPQALSIAMNSVSTVAYAQTRGDLQRLYFISMLTGMNYHQAAIPEEFPAPKSNTDFDPVKMSAMFEEGVRQVRQGTAWRRSPPGVEPRESPQERWGTGLATSPRGPAGTTCPPPP